MKGSYLINNNQIPPPPRPIPEIECKCGCGHSFQPKRKDQIYLNKQHADFGYNHGVRKKKQANRIKVEKILRTNDQVLRKFHELYKQDQVRCYLANLHADGFRSEYFIGQDKNEGSTKYYSFNFSYRIVVNDNKKMIIIEKL